MKIGARHIKSWTMVLSVFLVVVALCAVWKKYVSSPAGPLDAQFVDNPAPDISKVESGLVSLWASRDGADGSQISMIGCGVIVDPRGYVLTSIEIPENISSLYMLDCENDKFAVEVVTTDKKARLTLLRVNSNEMDPAQSFDVAMLGDSRRIERGGAVATVGARIVPGNSWQLETTTGRITKERQNLVVQGLKYRNLVQTDIELTAADAGGPLINQDGEVIGLALSDVNPPGSTGFSYAVPINQAKRFLAGLPIPRWVDGPGGQVCSWLGAETIPLNPVMATHLSPGQRRGEVVNHLLNNSPAERAGLKRGDVITSINGHRIADRATFDELAPQLCQTAEIQLTVLRDGRQKDITIRWDQPRYARSGSGSLAEVVLVLLIFSVMYFFVYKNIFDRVVLFVLGAIVVAIVGHHLGFYDQDRIAAALLTKIDVLCFIVGMHLVSGLLEESGAMGYLAKKITVVTGGDSWRVMGLFCVVTYGLSLVVNNLTTIMLMAPMVLKLSKYLDCNPKPFLISMIIASNLGGASTMVGDFPNMLIGSETGLGFRQFIIYMLPICLLELLILLVYLRLARPSLFNRGPGGRITAKAGPQSPGEDEYQDCQSWIADYPELADGENPALQRQEFLTATEQDLPKAITNRRALHRGLAILAAVTAGFLFSEPLHVSPAIIALGGGIVALAFGGCDPFRLMQKVSIKDILFFSGLFVLVGAAEAAGALGYMTDFIVRVSFGNVLVLCLLLMWTGALATCFLNAGPATALFLPVVLSLESAAPHHLYWWALSLGVCAGSSGTLTGATAGSITATMIDRFVKEEDLGPDASASKGDGRWSQLTFREFAAFGLPLMLIFLVVSSIYIIIVYSV